MRSNKDFKAFCDELESIIEASYSEGVTTEQAERLAARFLYAQMMVSKELTNADLTARMRKTGVKSLRAVLYKEEATKGDKKPTEAMLASIIDSNDLIQGEQNSYDESEVTKSELERYYDIFGNAHIYYRSLAKGTFGG